MTLNNRNNNLKAFKSLSSSGLTKTFIRFNSSSSELVDFKKLYVFGDINLLHSIILNDILELNSNKAIFKHPSLDICLHVFYTSGITKSPVNELDKPYFYLILIGFHSYCNNILSLNSNLLEICNEQNSLNPIITCYNNYLIKHTEFHHAFYTRFNKFHSTYLSEFDNEYSSKFNLKSFKKLNINQDSSNLMFRQLILSIAKFDNVFTYFNDFNLNQNDLDEIKYIALNNRKWLYTEVSFGLKNHNILWSSSNILKRLCVTKTLQSLINVFTKRLYPSEDHVAIVLPEYVLEPISISKTIMEMFSMYQEFLNSDKKNSAMSSLYYQIGENLIINYHFTTLVEDKKINWKELFCLLTDSQVDTLKSIGFETVLNNYDLIDPFKRASVDSLNSVKITSYQLDLVKMVVPYFYNNRKHGPSIKKIASEIVFLSCKLYCFYLVQFERTSNKQAISSFYLEHVLTNSDIILIGFKFFIFIASEFLKVEHIKYKDKNGKFTTLYIPKNSSYELKHSAEILESSKDTLDKEFNNNMLNRYVISEADIYSNNMFLDLPSITKFKNKALASDIVISKNNNKAILNNSNYNIQETKDFLNNKQILKLNSVISVYLYNNFGIVLDNLYGQSDFIKLDKLFTKINNLKSELDLEYAEYEKLHKELLNEIFIEKVSKTKWISSLSSSSDLNRYLYEFNSLKSKILSLQREMFSILSFNIYLKTFGHIISLYQGLENSKFTISIPNLYLHYFQDFRGRFYPKSLISPVSSKLCRILVSSDTQVLLPNLSNSLISRSIIRVFLYMSELLVSTYKNKQLVVVYSNFGKLNEKLKRDHTSNILESLKFISNISEYSQLETLMNEGNVNIYNRIYLSSFFEYLWDFIQFTKIDLYSVFNNYLLNSCKSKVVIETFRDHLDTFLGFSIELDHISSGPQFMSRLLSDFNMIKYTSVYIDSSKESIVVGNFNKQIINTLLENKISMPQKLLPKHSHIYMSSANVRWSNRVSFLKIVCNLIQAIIINLDVKQAKKFTMGLSYGRWDHTSICLKIASDLVSKNEFLFNEFKTSLHEHSTILSNRSSFIFFCSIIVKHIFISILKQEFPLLDNYNLLMQKIALNSSNNLNWNINGFNIFHKYSKSHKKVFKFKYKKITLLTSTNKLSLKNNKQAFAPNFIHSLDAGLIRKLWVVFNNNNFNLLSNMIVIHDAYIISPLLTEYIVSETLRLVESLSNSGRHIILKWISDNPDYFTLSEISCIKMLIDKSLISKEAIYQDKGFIIISLLST